MDTESEIACMIQDTIESAKLSDEKRYMAVYTAMQVITALFRDIEEEEKLWNTVPRFSEKVKQVNMSYTIYKIKNKKPIEVSLFSDTDNAEDILATLELVLDTISKSGYLYNKFENSAIEQNIPDDSVLHYSIGMENKRSKLFLEIEAECDRSLYSFIYVLNTFLTYILIMHECCLRSTKEFYDKKLHNELLDAEEMLRCSNISYDLKDDIMTWAKVEKHFAKRLEKIISEMDLQNREG
jgi:hypothetical protein